MTDNVENLVLEHLRAIRATQAQHGERLTQIEVQQTAVGQQLAGLAVAVYGGQGRLDKIEQRLERIERRLDLIDTQA
jgi:uncharacterized coiled-coil protein SlyX